ncbi:protein of unknown function [Pseudoxanthomonas sp. GM95]|uniref:DUF7844 domain-containing protein n=1 Tax=Pseudoxanthomonas sp. GM95 TaxID=1881043 RepID=UPI0008AA85AB|nr:DUF4105 domain-containing protein [Pseudoxanthomonas sp. GM95]SEK97333.1 protein of unknown function [Pseudoxanthomonas sp. GM95]
MRVRRPPRWRWLVALVCFGLLPSAQASLRWQPDSTGLNESQRAASQALLDDVAARLPPAWRDALGEVPVAWRDDLPERVHGRATGSGRILLPRQLLVGGMGDVPGGMAPDAPGAAAASAALIHELAHLLDRSTAGGFSRDPRLLDLAGWQVGTWPRLWLRQQRNPFTDRSPDPYELQSPREYVAVNLEHFLLDADYACRRPALAAYFAARLNTKLDVAACAPALSFFEDGAQPPLLAIDPARVYAVDYLLADGNREAMSRWGHSMLRLVICAPGRPRGPDCRLDLQQHRVLSFRAFIDDVQLSSWGGLTGRYPARLYLLPLAQVLDEYTQVQLRGLRSIPLALKQDEIASLLQRAAQVHWSYDGGYRFIANNCAVETYKLLHDGVPRLADAQLSGITPKGLLRRLERAGIADAAVLDDLSQAERVGYFFPAASVHYQAMFDVLRQALPLPEASVQAWLKLPPAQRAAWIERADLRSSAALLVLEQAARRQQEQAARDALKQRFLSDTHDVAVREGGVRLQALLDEEGFFAQPARLLAGQPGYGLPQQAERAFLASEAGPRAIEQRASRRALQDDAKQWLPDGLRADIEGTEGNLTALGERLRRLNREAGGLQLKLGDGQPSGESPTSRP